MEFYIETYGCTANVGDSQNLSRALLEMGHIPSSLDDADAVIVNTCAVTERSERKILRRLRLLQGERLIVVGCLPPAIPESIRDIRMLGCQGPLNASSARQISEYFINETKRSSQTSCLADHGLHKDGDRIAILNVAAGCNGSCSYCIVKKARGNLKSRSIDDLAEQAKELISSGAIELQITAQDTASYGSDEGTNLGQLRERLEKLPGDFMLRIGMMNPNSAKLIEDELIRAFKSPKVYRFLHIPVQSGSDKILQSMGRRYSASDFLDLVSSFRAVHPDLTIITDIIAGFPGETDWDFQESMRLIDILQPDKVNVTRFSARPGTPASRLYDMPDRIKKERSRIMTRLWLEIAEKRNRRYLGEVLEARITELGTYGSMKARAKNYLGIVVKGRPRLGSSVRVLVEESNSFYVSGRVVDD
ncbi:MAG: tRNA (N(6)-L-threonylcarbamoyladenosine(37)-C(2))-methylthiotransferase [Methanothrix sp.]